MKKEEFPHVSKELIAALKEFYRMPQYTLDKDIRKLDFISGQLSVIEFLESVNQKQTHRVGD